MATLPLWVERPPLPAIADGYQSGVAAQGKFVYVVQGDYGSVPRLAILKRVNGLLEDVGEGPNPAGRNPCLLVKDTTIYALQEFGDAIAYASVHGADVGGWVTVATPSSRSQKTPNFVAFRNSLLMIQDKTTRQIVLSSDDKPLGIDAPTLGPTSLANSAYRVIGVPIVVNDNTLYQLGGFDANGDSVRVYASGELGADDNVPEANLTWNETEPLNIHRVDHSAAVANSTLFAVGGRGAGPVAEVSYASIGPNRALSTWKKSPNLFPSAAYGSYKLVVVTGQ